MEQNMVGWFEIPVLDMNRAKEFYERVFDIEIGIHELGEFIMGWFPSDHSKPGASGSLVQHQMYKPSATQGPLVYFACEDLANEISKIEPSGGTVLQQKTEIGGGHGYSALFIDSEGNRIALHSGK